MDAYTEDVTTNEAVRQIGRALEAISDRSMHQALNKLEKATLFIQSVSASIDANREATGE